MIRRKGMKTRRSGFTPAEKLLKLEIAERDNYTCPISGRPGQDLCHVFIPKNTLKGESGHKTYSKYNLLYGDHEVNMNWTKPDRLTAANYLIKLYGVEAIQDWIDSLGLRSPFSVVRWLSSLEPRNSNVE